jgi:hypothetical protein
LETEYLPPYARWNTFGLICKHHEAVVSPQGDRNEKTPRGDP